MAHDATIEDRHGDTIEITHFPADGVRPRGVYVHVSEDGETCTVELNIDQAREIVKALS